MTSFELRELVQGALGNAIANSALFISMISAYLVVAYLIGSKLSKSQITIVNSLYLVYIATVIGGQFSILSTMTSLGARINEIDSSIPFQPPSILPIGIVALLIAIVAASLKFMIDIRSNRNNIE